MSSSALSAEPIGRVIGNYNSIDVLKNTKLVSGDKIIIPKRPTSISIVGEVLSPGSLLWEQKLTTKKYLEMAAGLTNNADKKEYIYIYPNGQAKNIQISGHQIIISYLVVLSLSQEELN